VYLVLLAKEITIDLNPNGFGRCHPDVRLVVTKQQVAALGVARSTQDLTRVSSNGARPETAQRE
jgi:hypothetical protein